MDRQREDDANLNFEKLVQQHYRGLYQFAFSLTRKEAEASDLTQQTFYVWATKGHQLRDASKVKTWLFSTLHREFLKARRKQKRFPHIDLDKAVNDVPTVLLTVVNHLDGVTVMQALGRVEELYQAPLALFYLEDCSYREIAEILEVPIGTVQSRIARGKAQLQKILSDSNSEEEPPTEKAPRG